MFDVTSRSLVRRSHFNVAKSRRTCTMARAHYLLWLAFAAIWRAPKRPLVARADRVHGIPKVCGDARVGRVLQHPRAFAVLDLPADFGAKLKVVALVINGPGTVCLHQDPIVGRRDELLDRQRPFAGTNADVGHADDR